MTGSSNFKCLENQGQIGRFESLQGGHHIFLARKSDDDAEIKFKMEGLSPIVALLPESSGLTRSGTLKMGLLRVRCRDRNTLLLAGSP